MKKIIAVLVMLLLAFSGCESQRQNVSPTSEEFKSTLREMNGFFDLVTRTESGNISYEDILYWKIWS